MDYKDCRLCPRQCGADRNLGKKGYCKCPDIALVAKTMLHKWEEPALAGNGGSGAIFFGGCTTVVSICSFVLFDTVLGIHELLANALSWILAVGFAYLTNRKWVFCSHAKGAALLREFLSFYAGRLITLGLEEGLLLVFVTWLGLSSTVIKLAAQVLVLIGNYVISKLLVFRNRKA